MKLNYSRKFEAGCKICLKNLLLLYLFYLLTQGTLFWYYQSQLLFFNGAWDSV